MVVSSENKLTQQEANCGVGGVLLPQKEPELPVLWPKVMQRPRRSRGGAGAEITASWPEAGDVSSKQQRTLNGVKNLVSFTFQAQLPLPCPPCWSQGHGLCRSQWC